MYITFFPLAFHKNKIVVKRRAVDETGSKIETTNLKI